MFSRRHGVAFTALLVMAFALLLVSGQTSLAKGKPPKDDDTTPPDAITDLAATTAAWGALRLQFTTVGDDGGGSDCTGAGRATAYDIRYDTAPIGSDADFAAATEADGEPEPFGCGVNQTYCLGGLQPGVLYYVAMKVIDDAGNVSSLSNVASAVSGSTLGAYVHVHDVQIWWDFHKGKSRLRGAFVEIRDEWGAPVEGALVTGEWSGDYPWETRSAVTDACGVANVPGRKISCKGGDATMVFTVTDVTHPAAQYDPGANVETSDSSFCN